MTSSLSNNLFAYRSGYTTIPVGVRSKRHINRNRLYAISYKRGFCPDCKVIYKLAHYPNSTFIASNKCLRALRSVNALCLNKAHGEMINSNICLLLCKRGCPRMQRFNDCFARTSPHSYRWRLGLFSRNAFKFQISKYAHDVCMLALLSGIVPNYFTSKNKGSSFSSWLRNEW